MAEINTGLGPDSKIEIVVTLSNYENKPSEMVMQHRQIVFKRGGILLAQPEIDELHEHMAIGVLIELIKVAAIQAIQFKETQTAHHTLRKVVGA